MRIKTLAVNVFRNFPVLYRAMSRTLHAVDRSFRSLNPGAPAAIASALEKSRQVFGDTGGDYYEFGLFRGYALWSAQQVCARLGLHDTRFFGFDSFKGLPEVIGIDRANREFFKGQFSCSRAAAEKYLTDHGIDWSRTHLIEGFYADVLTEDLRAKLPFRKARVAFLDCDLYSSTKEVLDWLVPYVEEGTIMLFDDWYVYGDDPELGEQKAFREFLVANPHLDAEDLGPYEVYGKSWLMHRRVPA